MRILFFLYFLCLSVTLVHPQEKYFYTGKDYGSESIYNPLSLILNGSFDIIQLENSSRQVFKFPYGISSRNVMKNLASPLGAVSRFGWGRFLRNEVFPLEFGKKGAQWWPNYQLHLIGGGMTYTSLKEWYEYHNFSYPVTNSIITLAGFHLLNEYVENDRYEGDNVDPIADIYIFDIGGIILFSFDNMNKFFREELNLADWSLQPSFNLSDLSLQNNGQYFSVKWKVPYTEKWHLFYYFGMNGLTGFSYKFANNEAISVGGGLRAKQRELINEKTNQMTIDMVWNAGIFYDRNNSLLASLFISGLTDYAANLNIYPGIIKFGKFSPGLWAVVRRNGSLIFGISTMYLPGIGFK